MTVELVPDMRAFNLARIDHVFVYGTLKRGFRLNISLAPSATFVGQATVLGYLFHMGGFPALILEPGGMEITGEVWKIDHGKHEELIRILDMIEGTPTHYHRVPIKVSTNHVCWVYIQQGTKIRPEWMLLKEGQWLYEKQTPVKWGPFMAEPDNHNLVFPSKPKLVYDKEVQCMVINQHLGMGVGQPLPMIQYSGNVRSSYSGTKAVVVSPPEKPPVSRMVELAWMDPKGEPTKPFDDKKPIEGI